MHIRRSRHIISGIQTIIPSSVQIKVATRYKALYFQALPLKVAYAPSIRAATPFWVLFPVFIRELLLRRPIIVTYLTSKRYSCSANGAITLEDLRIPCECLIAPLYVDLGSTAWSYRSLCELFALNSYPIEHQGAKYTVFAILYAAISEPCVKPHNLMD